ncbi:MAG: hypothetical protein ACD_63C00228G0002 [uncultured bacterium]|nr:MAG: hypothetical protein ACD_63C00228G0002 [uncultured bacterium]
MDTYLHLYQTLKKKFPELTKNTDYTAAKIAFFSKNITNETCKYGKGFFLASLLLWLQDNILDCPQINYNLKKNLIKQIEDTLRNPAKTILIKNSNKTFLDELIFFWGEFICDLKKIDNKKTELLIRKIKKMNNNMLKENFIKIQIHLTLKAQIVKYLSAASVTVGSSFILLTHLIYNKNRFPKRDFEILTTESTILKLMAEITRILNDILNQNTVHLQKIDVLTIISKQKPRLTKNEVIKMLFNEYIFPKITLLQKNIKKNNLSIYSNLLIKNSIRNSFLFYLNTEFSNDIKFTSLKKIQEMLL